VVKKTPKNPGESFKSIFVAATAAFFIAAGIMACSIPGITGPPTPDVLEDSELPHKVAILPFTNQTSNPDAGKIVRKMFYNFFSSLNYRDAEPFDIDSTLRSNDLYQKFVVGEYVSPQKLGQLLGVDAVIYGEVLSLGKIYALLYAENNAGLRARMVNCYSGKIIWQLEHTIHIREGDVPLSLTGLAASLVKTAISHQQATHMQAASELSMEMVATIPNPEALSEPPPRIQALVHNGGGKLLRSGDNLKVVLIGDYGQSASWSIPPLFKDRALQEKEPGLYIGAYRVQPQDSLPDGRLFGYLESKSGVRSQWMDTLGPLKIGEPTILPPIISQDTILTVENSPYLVEEALVVLKNAKFIVNPGTVIWFRKLGLIVKGELQILGTEEDPVQLAAIGSSNWKGIFLDQSSANNMMQNCKISNAEFGFRASKSNILIENSLFQDNVWGIVLEESSVRINNSLIRTSEKTGISARKTRLFVEGSTISENSFGGFLLENAEVQIEQNNIANNGQWEIKAESSGTVQAGNNWWGKATPEQSGIIGPVEIEPVLKHPVKLAITE
jgi:parallel beta-helix repeat protein